MSANTNEIAAAQRIVNQLTAGEQAVSILSRILISPAGKIVAIATENGLVDANGNQYSLGESGTLLPINKSDVRGLEQDLSTINDGLTQHGNKLTQHQTKFEDIDYVLGNLGNAATKNVGTTAGTVAAGDDPRFGSSGTASFTVFGSETKSITLTAQICFLSATSAGGTLSIPMFIPDDEDRLVIASLMADDPVELQDDGGNTVASFTGNGVPIEVIIYGSKRLNGGVQDFHIWRLISATVGGVPINGGGGGSGGGVSNPLDDNIDVNGHALLNVSTITGKGNSGAIDLGTGESSVSFPGGAGGSIKLMGSNAWDDGAGNGHPGAAAGFLDFSGGDSPGPGNGGAGGYLFLHGGSVSEEYTASGGNGGVFNAAGGSVESGDGVTAGNGGGVYVNGGNANGANGGNGGFFTARGFTSDGGGVNADGGTNGPGGTLHLEDGLTYGQSAIPSVTHSTTPTSFIGVAGGRGLTTPQVWLLVTLPTGAVYGIPAYQMS